MHPNQTKKMINNLSNLKNKKTICKIYQDKQSQLNKKVVNQAHQKFNLSDLNLQIKITKIIIKY